MPSIKAATAANQRVLLERLRGLLSVDGGLSARGPGGDVERRLPLPVLELRPSATEVRALHGVDAGAPTLRRQERREHERNDTAEPTGVGTHSVQTVSGSGAAGARASVVRCRHASNHVGSGNRHRSGRLLHGRPAAGPRDCRH